MVAFLVLLYSIYLLALITFGVLLRTGVLTHMSSDHAPSTLEQKRAGDIWNVHFGLPILPSVLAALLIAGMVGVASDELVLTPFRAAGFITTQLPAAIAPTSGANNS